MTDEFGFLGLRKLRPGEMHPRDLYPGCCQGSRNYGGENEIYLRVRGNQFQAYAHALVRGIPCRVVGEDPLRGETGLSVNSWFHRQVDSWCIEEPTRPPKIGSVVYCQQIIPPIKQMGDITPSMYHIPKENRR